MTPGRTTRPSHPWSSLGALSALRRSAPPRKKTASFFQSSEFRIPVLFPKPQPLGTCHSLTASHRGRQAAQRNTPGEGACTVRWAQTGCSQLPFPGIVAKNTCPVPQPPHCALNKSLGLLCAADAGLDNLHVSRHRMEASVKITQFLTL